MKKSQLVTTAVVFALGASVVVSAGAYTLRRDSTNMYGSLVGGKIEHDRTDLNHALVGASDERTAMTTVVCPHAMDDTVLASKLGCIK